MFLQLRTWECIYDSLQAGDSTRVSRASALALFTNGLVTASPPGPPTTGHLIVHEWGTFLSMQGSDGVTLGGMVDSDEVLPPFVRESVLRGLSRAKMLTKMETPVTYFYADRDMIVDVRVDMHHGVLTHWFPAVNYFEPTAPQPKHAKRPVGESLLYWHALQVVPERHLAGSYVAFPPIDKNSIWRFARQTDSAVVRMNRGTVKQPRVVEEKFLFYRGLGKFQLPLEVRSSGQATDTQLIVHNVGDQPLATAVGIRVEHGKIRFLTVPGLAAGASLAVPLSSFGAELPLESGVPRVKDAVAAELVQAGLYAKEARAMVNTWERSYFRTDGLRVLYLLPRRTTDAVIPITIRPAPNGLSASWWDGWRS